jgi:hypothetical protein
MVVGLLGFWGIGGKLMIPVHGKLMGKVTICDFTHKVAAAPFRCLSADDSGIHQPTRLQWLMKRTHGQLMPPIGTIGQFMLTIVAMEAMAGIDFKEVTISGRPLYASSSRPIYG